ncbi:MAG: 23S rRNA (guanosine(2251)-2'-O)-methyltransferase RlmB, partial [Pseudomonadales bacterium]|nr:23S rRNA (guanosine(2251)-2'-O)-methyltransferase RlmB [Pseudomonadales bacterium]
MAKPDWVFGLHSVSAILERHPERILEIYLMEGRQDQRISKVQSLADQQDITYRMVAKKVLDDIVRDGNHQGVAAKCRLAQPLREQDLLRAVEEAREPVLFLVLDSVTDPQNLGGCIRTADAVGATGVITTKDKAVGLTPVVRRVAVGAAEVVPFYQVT